MMQALVFEAPWRLRLEARAAPADPGVGEVIVRIRTTGICGTDIGILRGDYGARPGVVIGHESAGEVSECGNGVSSVRPGDRVVIDPTYHCGHCPMCRTERPNHCETKPLREAGVSQDGTFATFYRTDERFVHKIADHVGFAEASLTEPLSCALTGIGRLSLRADMDSAVIGAGPMGMLYCNALASRAITGTLVEKAPGRAALCAAILPPGWSLAAELDDRPESLDLIVDTTGVATDRSLNSLRRGGQLLTIGLGKSRCEIDPARMADRSLSIIGSIDSIGSFALARHMIEVGAIPAARMVSHQLPLEQYEEAFGLLGVDLAARRRNGDQIHGLKVVLTI